MEVPTWRIPGVISERRELKAAKSGAVFAHAVRITAMGGTFEMQTRDVSIANQFGEGEECVAVGTFEMYDGRLRLQVSGKAVAAGVAGRVGKSA